MPFIANYFYFITSVMLTGYLIIIGQSLFGPLLAAFIFALALKPLVMKLEQLKIPRLASTFIAVSLFVIVILSVIAFFTLQIKGVSFLNIQQGGQFHNVPSKVQDFISRILGISKDQQGVVFKDILTNVTNNAVSIVHNTLSFTTGFLTSFVLFIMSLFFFLYYRKFLLFCFLLAIDPYYHERLKKILAQIETVVIHYIFGLSLVISIIAILNSIGLLALGIHSAVFFGVLAAIFTLIPYIGIMIGASIPTLVAFFTTNSLWYPVGVMALFALVQFLEGNFLTPNIVGRQIRVNTFAAILGLITGELLLGITGVIFALPILAILKVIFDEFIHLRPLGCLIGPLKE